MAFDRITPIPICARDGDNVTTASARTPWHSGVSLIEALEAADITTAQSGSFRMPVQYVNRPDHTFRGYAGTITAWGMYGPGTGCSTPLPTPKHWCRASLQWTVIGPKPERAMPSPCCWTGKSTSPAATSWRRVLLRLPPTVLNLWIVWMDQTPLFRGRAYLLMLGTRTVVATVTGITTRLDMETLEEISARELALNEIGRVSISLSHPVVCEPYEISRNLGGFILIDRLTRGTVGAGMVTAAPHP